MSIVSLYTTHVHGQIWSQHDLERPINYHLSSLRREVILELVPLWMPQSGRQKTCQKRELNPLNPLESLNHTFVAFVWLDILDVFWMYGIMASSYQIISKYLMYPDHCVKVAIRILRPLWLLLCLHPWLLPWLLWLLPWLLPTLVLNLAVISALEHLHLHRSVAEPSSRDDETLREATEIEAGDFGCGAGYAGCSERDGFG